MAMKPAGQTTGGNVIASDHANVSLRARHCARVDTPDGYPEGAKTN
jgi:hypothetical protein